MKVFLSSDIEGTNGIASWSETDKKNGGEYNYFAAKMTEEVSAVCSGVGDFDPHAEILVKDAHDSARNIDHAKLPANVKLNRGWPGAPASMVNCLDNTYDAVIFTGYHSPAFTDGNPLAHTISSQRIARILINGVISGEFHIYYYAALAKGVPTVMLSGDKRLTELVREIDPDIITVATVEGYGNSSISGHPQTALSELRTAAKEAVSRSAALKSSVGRKLPRTFDIQITYKRNVDAFKASHFPGVKKIDDMTVGCQCQDFFDFMRIWMFI